MALTAVARAAAKAASARQRLDNEMRAAYAAGEPLRAIADAANVSHEQVRRVVQRVPNSTLIG